MQTVAETQATLCYESDDDIYDSDLDTSATAVSRSTVRPTVRRTLTLVDSDLRTAPLCHEFLARELHAGRQFQAARELKAAGRFRSKLPALMYRRLKQGILCAHSRHCKGKFF
jgi:hypothetical protein